MQKPNFLILAALSLALTAPLAPAFAQFAPGHAHAGARIKKADGRLKKLGAEIALTDAQKAQLKPILQNGHQQAEAIKNDTSLSADARKAKLKDLKKSTRTQMMAVLTPTQRTQLKAVRKEKRQAKKGAV
jgi:Spy/CpxP family protein refolding chaperone